ncbi:meiotic recombination protein REC114 [Trachemys scripta elegans]|uniref:meiotic recombination protein REC114 n=1 Tax=Trachemys scripta elegans TaxID=31138 RepID=UPI001551C4F9|nr:meiotic recombination protein REC114 [Trachemys scripta elegans]XP_053898431.1 meiotic recombination protein REC114 [Malaclemys terrapin pileata]
MAAADEVGCVWLGRKLSVTTSEPAGTLPCSVPEQARGAGTVSPLSSAETWPLKRYGRFVSPGAPPCGAGASASWKVLESNEESGHLILTIVVSGHFFISQRRAVQEGFSLIDAHKWLKIVRRADCLLFGSKLKNECRMFRIQFGGDSKEQALEHCYNCVQKLKDYVTVQVTDEQNQELHQGHSQLANSESQVKDFEQNTSMLHGPSHIIDNPPAQLCTSFPERQRSVTELAQSVLKSSTFELPLAYQHSVWHAEELGPFIRLCLMDQNFPAFVEEVETELKKLTEG